MNAPIKIDQSLNTKSKSNISEAILGSKYQELTSAEQVVLSLLDSFAPHDDATSWSCDYDLLMESADNSSLVESDQVMAIIGRLVGFQILDCSIERDDDKIAIWVSPWKCRHQLRHQLIGRLIERRRDLVDSVSTTTAASEPTQAA